MQSAPSVQRRSSNQNQQAGMNAGCIRSIFILMAKVRGSHTWMDIVDGSTCAIRSEGGAITRKALKRVSAKAHVLSALLMKVEEHSSD